MINTEKNSRMVGPAAAVAGRALVVHRVRSNYEGSSIAIRSGKYF